MTFLLTLGVVILLVAGGIALLVADAFKSLVK